MKRAFIYIVVAVCIKARKGELFESASRANKRMRKMLPEHLKEHLSSYGTIGRKRSPRA